ncbi:flagellar biosynthesis protein FlhB [Treponema pedis]|uniref:Flagellar biosynthetic protein FlhB n=1 Tax=Treponema pedis TaxID=409322 RepID=A0A7S7AWB8_9SPIR|nr:flagellar biosynthesis protein FlhB [Treponema pedis]
MKSADGILLYKICFDSELDYFNKLIGLQWFAAEDDGKTEDPTEHRIRKAREEGRVAKSQDLNAAVVVLFPVIALIILGPYMFKSLMQVISFFFERCTTESLFNGAWFAVFLNYLLKTVFPITIIAMLAGVISNIIQNRGFLFSAKPIQPNFQKITPNFARFFKRAIFSSEGLFNLAKSLFKVVIIGFIGYLVIKSNITTMISMLQVGFADSVFFIAKTAAKILAFAAAALVVLSIPDYIFQRKQFLDSLKMSKTEVTQEYKELEGDPMIKSQISRQMQAILKKTGIKNVPNADVVITNPTHYAVALQWKQGEMPAPMVIAKGTDTAAQNIKRIAREHDIPLMENVPLARALYANVDLGQVVPNEYYTSLSIIFMKVYAMKGKSLGGLTE